MAENTETPQARDVEMAVLGVLLCSPEASVKQSLEAGGTLLFYSPQHRLIYKAIEELHEHGDPIDQITVTQMVRDNNTLDKVGGEIFISRLITECQSDANFSNHLEILKGKHVLRSLLSLCKTTQVSITGGKAKPASTINDIDIQLSELKEFMTEKKLNLSDRIRDWVSVTERDISVTMCDKELGIVTKCDRATRRKIFQRLKEEGVVEPSGKSQGWYRKVDTDLEDMDPFGAETEQFHIEWPFEIEKYAAIYPGNAIILAGETNSGKTSFMLDFVRRNMKQHKVHYFNSEMGDPELRMTLERFHETPLDEWKAVKWYSRSDNFADVIRPDDINVIDYLEMYEDHFKMAGKINQIHKKLKGGIAIIGLQKPQGRDEGIGGQSTKDKCRLYLSMQFGKIKLVKVKGFGAIARQTGQNPNGMECDFDINSRGLVMTSSWYHSEGI